MKKIPTLFVRDQHDMKHVTDEVNPECAWVFEGSGVATRKYDGTCCMFDGQNWWARREVKPGRDAPLGFVEVDHDETTGKRVGWVGLASGSFANIHNEVQFRDVADGRRFTPGTYELCGPKINGNPERLDRHLLINHETDVEQTRILGTHPALIRHGVRLLAQSGWEGVVWHHPDGRMAKLKARDLGATP